MPRFAPFSSDLFRFVFRTNFCRPLVQIPENREQEISPKFFRLKFFMDVRTGSPCQMLVFPGFGSFWPDVRRDIRAKTSSLGWFSVSGWRGRFTSPRAGLNINTRTRTIHCEFGLCRTSRRVHNKSWACRTKVAQSQSLAIDFGVDGAKSPEIPQKKRSWAQKSQPEIANR